MQIGIINSRKASRWAQYLQENMKWIVLNILNMGTRSSRKHEMKSGIEYAINILKKTWIGHLVISSEGAKIAAMYFIFNFMNLNM